MPEATPGLWTVTDWSGDGKGYIEIRGINGEAIATIFPFAGKGGVGADVAQANAVLIVTAVAAFREQESLSPKS